MLVEDKTVRRRGILFVSGRSHAEWKIFVMNTDGSNRRKLTRSHAAEFDPVWSPDRTRIVFAAVANSEAARSDLYVMMYDGSQRRPLTRFANGILAGAPTWSPDGQRIAFSAVAHLFNAELEPLLGPYLYVLSAQGHDLRRLRQGTYPSWSPDGKKILFTTSGQGADAEHRLCTIEADGNPANVVTLRKGLMGAWSPDGTQIAYIDDGDRSPYGYAYENVFVMDADGSHPKQLTQEAGTESCPQWFEDGQQILFTRSDSSGKPQGLHAIGADGTGRRRISRHCRLDWVGGGIFDAPLEIPLGATREEDPDLGVLLDAIRVGDVAKLRGALDQGANPDAASPTGWSALMAACGVPAMVHVLLDQGANPNARTDNGRTALWDAVGGRQHETIRVLLERGASVDLRDLEGRTILLFACERGDLGVVELLLKAGADVNARDREGDAALKRAALGGHLGIVQALLSRNVDVNARGKSGRTALFWAANISVVQALLKGGADATVRDVTGRTALMWAEYKKLTEIAEVLRRSIS